MVSKQNERSIGLEQVLRSFKSTLTTEKIYYRKIDKDISCLLLELELSVSKLRRICHQLSINDYVKRCIIGNEHIAFFGKRVQSKTLLIGITINSNPIPSYIFLDMSSDP